ncbi:MAG: urate hydroxylase PuuD [Thermoleophilia bacterium]|nr:urate hydroxylase PuuD [Thermoleophilia bacterium]
MVGDDVSPALAALLDPELRDWLDLVLRWLHVVAAMVWIGTSFYFVALESHLRPAARPGAPAEAWEIHGGGFYRVEKHVPAPPELPEELVWFRWEAYGTWLSGFALFVVLYWLDAETYLLAGEGGSLGAGEAVAVSAALLVLGWLVYDGLCRFLRGHELWLAAAGAAVVAATAYALSESFSGRAVWIQTGAILGTLMVANVLLVIIPAHRELVRAKRAGHAPDPAPGLEARRRSVHNNYLTLPVVLAMLGPHFPFAAGHQRGWLILVALMAIGAWTRHFFNLRHAGRSVWAIPVAAALATVVLAATVASRERARDEGARADFATARSIVERRCTPCHSTAPSRPGFGTAPGGVAFDTGAQIVAQAAAIERQAVASRAMPLGNATGMTDEERAQLGAWIDAGAPSR